MSNEYQQLQSKDTYPITYLSQCDNRFCDDTTTDSCTGSQCRFSNEEQNIQSSINNEISESPKSIDTLKQEGLDFLVSSSRSLDESGSSMAGSILGVPKLQRSNSVGILNFIPYTSNNTFDNTIRFNRKREREDDIFSDTTLSCSSSESDSDSSRRSECRIREIPSESERYDSGGKGLSKQQSPGLGGEQHQQEQIDIPQQQLVGGELGITDGSTLDGSETKQCDQEVKTDITTNINTPILSRKQPSRRTSIKRNINKNKRTKIEEIDILAGNKLSKFFRVNNNESIDNSKTSYYQKYHKLDTQLQQMQQNLYIELNDCNCNYKSELSNDLINSYEKKDRSCKVVVLVSGLPIYVEELNTLIARKIESVFLDYKVGINQFHILQNNMNENDKWLQTHLHSLAILHHMINFQEGTTLEDLQYVINDSISQHNRQLQHQFSQKLKTYKHNNNFLPPFFASSQK